MGRWDDLDHRRDRQTAQLAAGVRSAIGDSIPIQVAPTPEIEEARLNLEECFVEPGDAGTSYGALPEPVVAELFSCVAAMARARPWAVIDDCQLRLDIPDFDVDGMCVNLVETADHGAGMLIFPSREAPFALEANWQDDLPNPGLDLGSGWIALGFVKRDDVPVTVLDAIDQNGWEVAGRRWYPVVHSLDRFGAPATVMERDIRVIKAAALASIADEGSHFRIELRMDYSATSSSSPEDVVLTRKDLLDAIAEARRLMLGSLSFEEYLQTIEFGGNP